MILQRDKYLSENLTQYAEKGCYEHCLLYLVNKYQNESITPQRIVSELHPMFVKNGWVTDNCYIMNPVEVLAHFGVPVTGVRFAGIDYQCLKDEIEINRWEYKARGWKHFVCGNGGGITTFDPWGISITATKGKLVDKRIFTLEV
jgi:hypothetical protein